MSRSSRASRLEGGVSLRVERRPQRRQQRRAEGLPLQAHQRLGKQLQLVRRLVHRLNHGADPLVKSIQEVAVHHQGHQEEVPQPRNRRVRQPHQAQRRRVGKQERRRPREARRRQGPHAGPPSGRQQRRRLAPGRQRHRVHARARLFGQDGQFLPQVHSRPQFIHRFLPGPYGVRRGRLQQPARQRILADVRPRRAQQLEQRALPEQVEVPRIGMGRVQIHCAAFSAAGPRAIQARQTPLVVPRRPLALLHLAQQPFMHHHENHKGRPRKRRPQNRQGLRQRQSDDGQRARRHCQTPVPQRPVAPLAPRNLSLPLGEALGVQGTWIGMHWPP